MKKLILSPLALAFLVLMFSSCRDLETIRHALEIHTIEGAEYVGSETCALCHEDIVKKFPLSTHDRIAIPLEGKKVEGCEMCHGPGSKHVDAEDQDKAKFINNPGKDPSTCFACHAEKKAEFQLPYHHPLIEGKMSCTDCHDPHGPEARPWTHTSLSGVNETCGKCHQEQAGPFVWEHEALQQGCTMCHQVHGSITDKMLVARDANLCLRCHAQSIFPTFGNFDHTGRMAQGTCFSGGCHTAVHGSNFDEHLRS